MYHLDELDIRIIREIGSPENRRSNVRVSYAAISRKLGVDEETVRLRVGRARRNGVFPIWRLMVNPLLLGCTSHSLELEIESRVQRPRVLDQLAMVDGITRIVDYREGGVQLTLFSEGGDALTRQLALIEAICGSRVSSMWSSRYPSPAIRMRRLDWKIVQAMHQDAGMDISEMARSLGVSARTIQRRLAKMKEGNAVFLSGTPNVKSVSGMTCCFVVHCPDPRSKESMDSVVQADFSRLGHVDASPTDYTHIGVPCENHAEADQLLGRLRSMPGVQEAHMSIMNALVEVEPWLGYQIKRRAAGNSY